MWQLEPLDAISNCSFPSAVHRLQDVEPRCHWCGRITFEALPIILETTLVQGNASVSHRPMYLLLSATSDASRRTRRVGPARSRRHPAAGGRRSCRSARRSFPSRRASANRRDAGRDPERRVGVSHRVRRQVLEARSPDRRVPLVAAPVVQVQVAASLRRGRGAGYPDAEGGLPGPQRPSHAAGRPVANESSSRRSSTCPPT